MKSLIVDYSFEIIKDYLENVPNVDMVTTGMSPATIRFLTNENKYINVGLEVLNDDSCEVVTNNNSYEVTNEELTQVHTAINTFLKGNSDIAAAMKEGKEKRGAEKARRKKIEDAANASKLASSSNSNVEQPAHG